MSDVLARLNRFRDRSHDSPLAHRIGASMLAVVIASAVMYSMVALNSHHIMMVYMIVTSLAVLGYGVAGALSAGLTSAVLFIVLFFIIGPVHEHGVTVADILLLTLFVAINAGVGAVSSRLHQSEREARRAAEHQSFVASTAAAAAEHSVSLSAEGPMLSSLRRLAQFDEIALFRLVVNDTGGVRFELASGGAEPADLDRACMLQVAEVAEAWGRNGLEHKGLSAELALSSAVPVGEGRSAVYLPLLTADRVEGVLYLRSDPGITASGALEQRMSGVVHELRLLAVILERQRLEGEAAAAQAKIEAQSMQAVLMQSLTHELKTPLAATRALVSHWVDEPESVDRERLTKDAEMVDRAMSRLETSINELLEISRLKTADWTPRKETCEVADVLGSLFAQLPERWRDALLVDVEDVPMFLCDQKMAARLLESFVCNAFIYGAEPITIRAFTRDGLLVWEVEDRGPGLEPEEMGQLFDPFFRGVQAMKRSAGTGLGLAIADEIARLLGGTIEVSNVLPSGACFRFFAPIVYAMVPDEEQLGWNHERESDAG